MLGSEKMVIGILGGGQLAQMMAQAAQRLNLDVIVYCEEIAPCCENAVRSIITAPFSHFAKLGQFATECDFITAETENVPVEAIEFLEKKFPKKMQISSKFFGIAQNRIKEKNFASSIKIPTVEYLEVLEKDNVENFLKTNGECILKTVTDGYDGKGQYKITKSDDIPKLSKSVKYIVEQKIDFAFEVSTIITKKNREAVVFPMPLNIHLEGILRESILPLAVEGFSKQKIEKIQNTAIEYAKKIAESVIHNGTFAVEFFVLKDGVVLFNEMAPRPHNSGHFSIDLCNVSQFENHVRAVAGLPILHPFLMYAGSMINIIGDDVKSLENYLDKPDCRVHLYGKKYAKGRKLGHVNKLKLEA